MKTCTTKDCPNEILAKGLCTKCYYRVKRGGTPELSKKQQMALRTCSIEGCNKKHQVDGLCGMHRMRKERHGDPLYINSKCNRDGKYLERAVVKSATWKKENPKLNNAYNKTRKRKIKQTKLKSVKDEDMIEFYVNCPEGYQVDHIIPINHEHVSGLHVTWNMQYLTKTQNMFKSNKFDGTYENESWRKDIDK